MEVANLSNREEINSVNTEEYKQYLEYLYYLKTVKEGIQEEVIDRSGEEKGKMKVLRNGNIPQYGTYEEETYRKTGYTNIPMLSFLTFLFEIFFLLITFQMFK